MVGMISHRPLTLVRRFGTKPELSPLPRTYDARYVESRWYDWWIAKKFFTPGTELGTKSTNIFTIILPPPNVTGSLHLGHALTIAVEDAVVRYNRMQGRQVLWLPGLDHAGIATQVQVEKDLWSRRKLTRHQVGREEFLRCAEVWKEEKAQRIKSQIRRLGAGVDWDRMVFTLDEKIQHGVREAFIRLHDEGKMYRQERLINWCGYLQSTISDIEVEHRQIDRPMKIRLPGENDPVDVGYLSHFAYPVLDSTCGEEVVVATTRLETMIGDSAVAVHPDDSRFKHLHGRKIQHPLLDRTMNIILDSSVDPALGTGAVKITPAHDFKDFETGGKHSLLSHRVIDDAGRMISLNPEIHGLSRFAARTAIERLLTERNRWRGRTPHATVLPMCSRSGDIIEPQLKEQWFLDCESYSKEAMAAVESGRLQIVPQQFASQWNQWLGESKDWCLSRQLWWGQRIPAYKAVVNGKETWTCAHSKEEAIKKLQQTLGADTATAEVYQDNDFLDTWFTSSALPFLAFGWPNVESPDFKQHYPLTLMETGHDILFFWVARMVFLGVALTDTLPFKKILLHGLVCDKHGKKMSKSTGNVIDPMEIICDLSQAATPADRKSKVDVGSDALRFALCQYETQQHFISVDVKHIEEANKFCNKIWQAFHLCFGTWDQFPTKVGQSVQPDLAINRWIISCLADLVAECNTGMESLKLDVATNKLYSFMHHDFCDAYLECTKPFFKTVTDPHACQEISSTMLQVMDVFLRLVSLFMPNLAEELYQRLPLSSAESVCVAAYPQLSEISIEPNQTLKRDFSVVLDIARAVKNIRPLYGLFKDRVPLYVILPEESKTASLKILKDALVVLSRSASVTFVGKEAAIPNLDTCVFDAAKDGLKVYVQVGTRFNVEREKLRLLKRIRKLTNEREEIERELEDNKDRHYLAHTAPKKHLELRSVEEQVVALSDRHTVLERQTDNLKTISS